MKDIDLVFRTSLYIILTTNTNSLVNRKSKVIKVDFYCKTKLKFYKYICDTVLNIGSLDKFEYYFLKSTVEFLYIPLYISRSNKITLMYSLESLLSFPLEK